MKAERAKRRALIETEHKAWQILTPAQKDKAKALIEKRVERMEKRLKRHQDN